MFSQLNKEEDARYTLINDQIFREYTTEVVYLTVNFSNNMDLFMIAHPRREVIKNFENNEFLKYEFKGSMTKYIRMESTKFHSLSKPYETDCLDYRVG